MKKLMTSLVFVFGIIFMSGCEITELNGPYFQGTYYAMDLQTQITAFIVINEQGTIEDVLFDAFYNGTTMNTLDEDYLLDSGKSWKDEAEELADYLVSHQGWTGIELVISDISGLTSVSVPDHFISVDLDNSSEDIPDISIPLDGFVLSWNIAIAKASMTDEGVIPNVPTSEEWLEANKPPFDYLDGTYYGSDESHGYIVRVEIHNGFITDVVFDAITAVNTRIVWNDNGTPADESDDFPEVELVSMTTKQAIGDALVMVSGIAWRVEAEMMEAAILRAQAWDPNWLFDESTGHEYFDFDDSFTLDSVAGVTLAIEGFRATFEEAINQARLE